MVYVASGLILGTTLVQAPNPQYSLGGYLLVIYSAYLPTQLPIAVGEALITGMALHYAGKQRPEILASLGILSKKDIRQFLPVHDSADAIHHLEGLVMPHYPKPQHPQPRMQALISPPRTAHRVFPEWMRRSMMIWPKKPAGPPVSPI